MLHDKYAIITGCGRGIGRSIMDLYAKNGATIFAIDVESGSLDDCVELEQKYRVNIYPYYFNVSDRNSLKLFFKEMLEITKQIDILVNNAGISFDSTLPMLSSIDLQEIFEVNTFAPIYMMQYVSKLMAKQKFGSIINMASIIGINGNYGQTAYAASKAALIAATKSVAKEMSQFNVRVNAIAPGFIDTPMTKSLPDSIKEKYIDSIKMHRMGDADEVAQCALFLASKMSSYISGAIINIDGCMSI